MSTKANKPKTEKSAKKSGKSSGVGGVGVVRDGGRDAVVVPDKSS